ncbi:hypothetical protein Ciccas_004461 [Cichlidogyrus casuarinus]|uniref:C2H2-type domain-containing protein n=1 Tax=Cichlidogyrus casuarinus TaxID=1844966 RepID=A0ABD2QBF4_9PLAT
MLRTNDKGNAFSSDEEDGNRTQTNGENLLHAGSKKPRCRSTSPQEANSGYFDKPKNDVSSHSAPSTYGFNSPPPSDSKKSHSPSNTENSASNGSFASFMNRQHFAGVKLPQLATLESKLDPEDKEKVMALRPPNELVATPNNNMELRHWRVANADRLNALIDECERHIDGRKVYKCKYCGKVYEIKSSMRYHMKIIHLQLHLKTSEMQCRVCGKQFTCISAVNRHQSKCIAANGVSASHTERSVTQRSPSPQSPSPYSFTDGIVQGRNPASFLPAFQERIASLNPKLFGGLANSLMGSGAFQKRFEGNGMDSTPPNLEEMLNQISQLTKAGLATQHGALGGENVCPPQESFTSAFLRHLNTLSGNGNNESNSLDNLKNGKLQETELEKFSMRRFPLENPAGLLRETSNTAN